MIKDCLVVGIKDKVLSEQLQLDASLTLERVKTAIRQCEAVQDNRGMLNGFVQPHHTKCVER